MRSVGRYELRGVAGVHEVFTLIDDSQV
jgi:hypothetical protein